MAETASARAGRAPDDEVYTYEGEVVWSRDRRGTLHAGTLPSLDVAPPPEFKGEAGVWNPEQLLLAAANACLMNTFFSVAEKARIHVASYSSSAKAWLTRDGEGGYAITSIELRPVIVVQRGKDAERAKALIQLAEGRCLIARSLKYPTRVEAHVRVSEEGPAQTPATASRAL